MNKRIKKKIKKRYGFKTYNKYKQCTCYEVYVLNMDQINRNNSCITLKEPLNILNIEFKCTPFYNDAINDLASKLKLKFKEDINNYV